jgi:hypothetical protein
MGYWGSPDAVHKGLMSRLAPIRLDTEDEFCGAVGVGDEYCKFNAETDVNSVLVFVFMFFKLQKRY